jgi:hypothetical protein
MLGRSRFGIRFHHEAVCMDERQYCELHTTVGSGSHLLLGHAPFKT